MGFNDWFYVDPTPSTAESRLDEVESGALRRLAEELQPVIRNHVDPGVDVKDAARAQAVRVRAEEGQIIIDEDDHAAVLTGGHQFDKPARKDSSVMDLFAPSTGYPSVTGRGGKVHLSFREIDEKDVFRVSEEEEVDAIHRTVTDKLRMGLVDAIEGAITEVKRRYPGE